MKPYTINLGEKTVNISNSRKINIYGGELRAIIEKGVMPPFLIMAFLSAKYEDASLKRLHGKNLKTFLYNEVKLKLM